MKKNRHEIPIFFAVDDGYVPFLAVTLQSLIEHSSKENRYLIKILYTNMSTKNKNALSRYNNKNINIEFVDFNKQIELVKDKLYTRDYYSNTTYFRLFIPNLYREYDKVLYLDSDIVILDDIAKLYNIDIEDNLLVASQDQIILNYKTFSEYAEKVVKVQNFRKYFNAGILSMNLKELRNINFEEKFISLLESIKFPVAQDQDYLNRLCRGKVKLIDIEWNLMPIKENANKKPKIIHYNLINKPWHFDNIIFENEFWKYAQKTEYYEEIQQIKKNYTDDDRQKDIEQNRALELLAQEECNNVCNKKALK